MGSILVTGAAGMIGTAICNRLHLLGHGLIKLDIRTNVDSSVQQVDVADAHEMDRILNEHIIDGVIHLAAVSRVVTAEHDPALCFATNVAALSHLVDRLLAKRNKPWLIFASSREVYGQPNSTIPVREDQPNAPMNVYGHAKCAGEAICRTARQCGLPVLILRFSSVYGWVHDYPNRVVPAFVRAALHGGELRVEGPENTFDYVHIRDVETALLRAIKYISSHESPVPALHIVTGSGTSLGELSQAVVRMVGNGSIKEYPGRSYDVTGFYGDPALAYKEMGWRASIDVPSGLRLFIREMKQCL